jgi:hypothetical protein
LEHAKLRQALDKEKAEFLKNTTQTEEDYTDKEDEDYQELEEVDELVANHNNMKRNELAIVTPPRESNNVEFPAKKAKTIHSEARITTHIRTNSSQDGYPMFVHDDNYPILYTEEYDYNATNLLVMTVRTPCFAPSEIEDPKIVGDGWQIQLNFLDKKILFNSDRIADMKSAAITTALTSEMAIKKVMKLVPKADDGTVKMTMIYDLPFQVDPVLYKGKGYETGYRLHYVPHSDPFMMEHNQYQLF